MAMFDGGPLTDSPRARITASPVSAASAQRPSARTATALLLRLNLVEFSLSSRLPEACHHTEQHHWPAVFKQQNEHVCFAVADNHLQPRA